MPHDLAAAAWYLVLCASMIAMATLSIGAAHPPLDDPVTRYEAIGSAVHGNAAHT
jgi:hypothetical protein